jgi:hypothetical protein
VACASRRTRRTENEEQFREMQDWICSRIRHVPPNKTGLLEIPGEYTGVAENIPRKISLCVKFTYKYM